MFVSIKRKNAISKGKRQRDQFDVISIFKEMDPEFVPIFVAQDLQRLPHVTSNHIDVSII